MYVSFSLTPVQLGSRVDSDADSGSPRFLCRRHQQIPGLLATPIPIIYSKSHRIDENPAFIRVKISASWSRGGSAPSCAGCPPQQQCRVNTSCIGRSIRSTVIHVKFAPPNWYKSHHEEQV
ncbi:hypothetical protein Y032_0612g666 [Ancylostoma ceylanicum]|nr:hypothetical protein Y032_0612g666 [Ancylostoma ceylanicum]